jgi:hypothetical protein
VWYNNNVKGRDNTPKDFRFGGGRKRPAETWARKEISKKIKKPLDK